jgi:hypothetical protein
LRATTTFIDLNRHWLMNQVVVPVVADGNPVAATRGAVKNARNEVEIAYKA